MRPVENMQHIGGFISGDQPIVRELSNPASVAQAFTVLDRDGDGKIRSWDLRDFFGTCMGLSTSQEEADAMITAADWDGDGAVNLAEFQCLLGIGAAHGVPKTVDLNGIHLNGRRNRAANLEHLIGTRLVSETAVLYGDNAVADSSGCGARKTTDCDHGKGVINLAEFQSCLAVNSSTAPFGHQSDSRSQVCCGAQADLGSEFRRLSADEFLSLDPETEALLWETFCVLDADKDGLLNPHDLKCAMTACGCPSFSEAELHAMLTTSNRADGRPCASTGMDFKSFISLLSI